MFSSMAKLKRQKISLIEGMFETYLYHIKVGEPISMIDNQDFKRYY